MYIYNWMPFQFSLLFFSLYSSGIICQIHVSIIYNFGDYSVTFIQIRFVATRLTFNRKKVENEECFHHGTSSLFFSIVYCFVETCANESTFDGIQLPNPNIPRIDILQIEFIL